MTKLCGFAFPGTYGHECGAPAIMYAVKPSDNTRSGIYYGPRCAKCMEAKGRDNDDVIRYEPIGAQVNNWK